MRLKSKKALVTGAGSHGIGKEIALAFAREGADVALHHFNHPDIAAAIATEIRAMGRSGAHRRGGYFRPGRRTPHGPRRHRAPWRSRHLGRQCRGNAAQAVPRIHRRRMGLHSRGQSARLLSLCAGSMPASGGARRRRADYFRVLGQPETSRSFHGALLRLQGRRHAARGGNRHRNGAASDHLQSDLAGHDHLRSHPQRARRRAREAPRHAGADGAGRPVRGMRRRGGVFRQRRIPPSLPGRASISTAAATSAPGNPGRSRSRLRRFAAFNSPAAAAVGANGRGKDRPAPCRSRCRSASARWYGRGTFPDSDW